MDNLTCPICGETFENRMKLGSHMWTKHKVKLKEYEAGLTAQPEVNESVQPKAADGLIKPAQITESKEFINEPAVKVDKEFVTENTVSDGEFVKQSATYHNPYKDLYKDDGMVINEYLGR
jgi:hypothetical protein